MSSRKLENICFSCLQWIVQRPNYNVTAKKNSQIIFDSRWQAMNMTKFGYFEYQNFARSGLTGFIQFVSKNWILEQTHPVLVTLVQGSINIESMSEIKFLAVSAILIIISDFYWHWLLNAVWSLRSLIDCELGDTKVTELNACWERLLRRLAKIWNKCRSSLGHVQAQVGREEKMVGH